MAEFDLIGDLDAFVRKLKAAILTWGETHGAAVTAAPIRVSPNL